MSSIPHPIPSSPQSTVESDIPCRTCGYNLRSLPTDGLCPECGTRADYSLRGDWLLFTDPQWIRKLGLGTNLMVLGLRISVIACGLVIAYRGRPLRLLNDPKYIGSGFRPLFSSIYIGLVAMVGVGFSAVGAWLATTADPGEIESSGTHQLRRIIRVTCLIYAIDTLIQVAAIKVAIPPSAAFALRLVDQAADLINVVAISAQLHYFRNLARRIPDLGKAARADALKWLPPILYSVWFMVAVVRWRIPSPGISNYVMTRLADVARLAGVAYVTAWLAYMALLVTLGRQFRRQATYAAEYRATHSQTDAPRAVVHHSEI